MCFGVRGAAEVFKDNKSAERKLLFNCRLTSLISEMDSFHKAASGRITEMVDDGRSAGVLPYERPNTRGCTVRVAAEEGGRDVINGACSLFIGD